MSLFPSAVDRLSSEGLHYPKPTLLSVLSRKVLLHTRFRVPTFARVDNPRLGPSSRYTDGYPTTSDLFKRWTGDVQDGVPRPETFSLYQERPRTNRLSKTNPDVSRTIESKQDPNHSESRFRDLDSPPTETTYPGTFSQNPNRLGNLSITPGSSPQDLSLEPETPTKKLAKDSPVEVRSRGSVEGRDP